MSVKNNKTSLVLFLLILLVVFLLVLFCMCRCLIVWKWMRLCMHYPNNLLTYPFSCLRRATNCPKIPPCLSYAVLVVYSHSYLTPGCNSIPVSSTLSSKIPTIRYVPASYSFPLISHVSQPPLGVSKGIPRNFDQVKDKFTFHL